MSRESYQRHEELITEPLPMTLGGTGASSVSQAVANLQLSEHSKIAQASGIVPLDENGKIPVQFLPPADVHNTSVNGPLSGIGGNQYTYKITDYDFDTTYVLSCSTGSINRTHDIINFTLPFGVSETTFTLNGATYTIAIPTPSIDKPIFTIPINEQEYTSNTLIFNLNPFVPHNWDSSLTSTDWELATDVNFTNIVQQSLNEVDNLYSLVSIPLIAGTTYYLRARFKSSPNGNLVQSPWSDVIQFVKTQISFPTTLTQILSNTDPLYEVGSFGEGIAISPDGTVIVVGDSNATNTTAIYGSGFNVEMGAVFIYKKVNDIWTRQHTLVNPTLGVNDGTYYTGFGQNVFISPDKQKIFVPEYTRNNLSGNNGVVRFYETAITDDYSTLYLKQTIEFPYVIGSTDGSVDTFISMNHDASLLAIGNSHTGGSVDYNVLIMELQAGLYVLRDTVLPPVIGNYADFGVGVKLSNDGLTLFVSQPRLMHANGIAKSCIDIFNYTNNAWVFAETLWSELTISDRYFAYPYGVNKDATVLAASFENDLDGTHSVYFFEYNGTNWVRTAIVTPAQWGDAQLGGELDSIKFSDDGRYVFMGSRYQSTPATVGAQGPWDGTGAVLLYEKVGGVWTNIYNYYPDRANIGSYIVEFGGSIDINSLGSMGVFSAPYGQLTTDAINTGLVYCYE